MLVSFEDNAKGMARMVIHEKVSFQSEKARKMFNKGVSYWKKGKYTKARIKLKESLKIEPDHHNTLNHLGLVEMYARDFEKAIKYFHKSLNPDTLTENGRPKNAMVNLAWTYFYNKDFHKSLDSFQFIIENTKVVDDAQDRMIAGNACLGKTHNHIRLENCEKVKKVFEDANELLKDFQNLKEQLNKTEQLILDCNRDLDELKMD